MAVLRTGVLGVMKCNNAIQWISDRGCVEDQPQKATSKQCSPRIFHAGFVSALFAAGLRHSRGPFNAPAFHDSITPHLLMIDLTTPVSETRSEEHTSEL